MSLLYKNTRLKIGKSFGRYISLLVIIMVGVGFYAGIQATAPDIVKVADGYYKDYVLMDFKIVSSLGLTDDDVYVLKQLGGVVDVVASYSLDVQSRGRVIRVHSIEDNVNIVKLIEGQMPLSDTECIADVRNYNIGDIIEITSDVDGKIRNVAFIVVGLVDSVLYLHDDYGSTNVGNGHLSSFIFINKDNFVLDAYTEIYLTIETFNAVAYSDEYVANTVKFNDQLVSIKPDRETARFDEIYREAMAIIEKNEAKLNNEIEKAEKEFSDAKLKLDNSLKELNDGKAAGIKEFEAAKAVLDENAKKLQDAKTEITHSEAQLDDLINTKNAEFDLARQQITEAWQEINSALMEAGITADKVDIKIYELESAVIDMQTQLDSLSFGSPAYEALYATLVEYTKMLDGLKQIKLSIDTLNEQEKQLDDGIAVFNAEIEKALNEIENAKNEVDNNEKILNEEYADYYVNLALFNAEIVENEKKLNDGYLEYYENLETFDAEITDATRKINDAKTELSNIKHPQWYIFDRNAAIGYSALDSSIQIVAVVATVFPLFFILISMLMTSNSMTRMITEERGELGTLTSLGYTDRAIVFTYLLYVLSASGIGAVIGFFIGCRIFPPLIYANFTFILPPLALEYNMITFGIIFAITFILMSLVTLVACRRELKQKPASLMRPLPPKHGQQIFLEKITFIWKRLSFTWKVTMRNMFRYKKRVFMTIVGIAGCASLLIIAFGIHDGMSGIAQRQYGDILRYDNMIILKDETQTINGELQTLLDNQQITNPLLIRQSAYKCENNKKTLDAFLIVPQNNELFEQHFSLKSTIDKKGINLEDGAVVITHRIAVVYNLQKGDTLTIEDTDNNSYNLLISNIAENYASNYIYANTFTYEKTFGKPLTFNAIVSNNNTDKTDIATILIDSGFAVNVIFANDMLTKVLDNAASLTGVIILIVIVASILTIVVLYNLTAISISERTREIATLKVLGFRDSETNAYIYREAIILTLISIGIGMILGVILHHLVVNIIEINALSLHRTIKWTSYAMACIITMIFSIFMQIITHFKLKKIDMIESLKSIE
jgi:putative ABC transport system permease protein